MRARPFVAFGLVLLACGSSGNGASTSTDAGAGITNPDGGTTTDPGSSSGNPDGGPGVTTDGASLVPYDQVVMKAVHNAYDRDEPLIDMLLFHRVRNVEIDIHKGKGDDAPAGQWWVYHADIPTQDRSSCTMLADCLGELLAFHKALPMHEVITVYLDLKDGFVDGHQPADLDNAITSVIGRENVIAPADVIAKCKGATDLRSAVAKPCGFPSLASLRGKFLFTATGGSLCDATTNDSAYIGQNPNARIVFVAPDVSSSCTPAQYDAHPGAVILNMAMSDIAQAGPTKAKGLVGRMYGGGLGGLSGGLDSESDFNAAKAAGVSQLATDEVNAQEDTWSTTTGRRGYPFQCAGCDGLVEAGNVIGVIASSGDQYDAADSGYFAYENDPGEATWTTMIGVPSSHTEDFAKACLIARASDDPSSANVALCRPFDNHPPRIQVRPSAGASTSTTDAPTFAGLSDETGLFMRLTFKPDGASTTVIASVSKDGTTWNDFQTTVVNALLPLRGVSVSSHGSGLQRALFASVTKNVPDLPPEPITAAKLSQKAIGADATGSAFDGIFGP